MLSAEIISALIQLSQWTNPGLNHLFYFIVGALAGKESSHLKCQKAVQGQGQKYRKTIKRNDFYQKKIVKDPSIKEVAHKEKLKTVSFKCSELKPKLSNPYCFQFFLFEFYYFLCWRASHFSESNEYTRTPSTNLHPIWTSSTLQMRQDLFPLFREIYYISAREIIKLSQQPPVFPS